MIGNPPCTATRPGNATVAGLSLTISSRAFVGVRVAAAVCALASGDHGALPHGAVQPFEVNQKSAIVHDRNTDIPFIFRRLGFASGHDFLARRLPSNTFCFALFLLVREYCGEKRAASNGVSRISYNTNGHRVNWNALSAVALRRSENVEFYFKIYTELP